MQIITSGNKNSPFYNPVFQEKYLSKYINLRYEIFTSLNRPHYTPEPESYDLYDDTSFIYFVDKEVLGGRRIVLHKPNSNTKLKTEQSILKPISKVYPYLNTENLTYAELGGLCFHPSIQGQNLSQKLYELTFVMLQQLDCDFFIAETVPENTDRMIKNAQLNGVKQIVQKPEDTSEDGFHDYRIFMSFKEKSELDLQ